MLKDSNATHADSTMESATSSTRARCTAMFFSANLSILHTFFRTKRSDGIHVDGLVKERAEPFIVRDA